MADLRPPCSVLLPVKPYVAVHPADLDDGDKFLDGEIRRRELKSKLPPMYLRYGFLMIDYQPPNADSEKQVLDRSPEVEAEVVDGEDENGYRVFEIYFSQDDRNYLVKLAFSPQDQESDDDDEDSPLEEEELGSDYYSGDGEKIDEDCEIDDEEETYEDEQSDDEEEMDEDYEIDDEKETYEDEQSDDEERLTGNRDFELYFLHGDRRYVIRLVFEIEGAERFLEEEDEFLFTGLQRVVGISSDKEKEEGEVSEISWKLMEVKIGERPDEIRTTEDGEKRSTIVEYNPAETAERIKNAIGSDQSSDTLVDSLMILE